MDAKQLIARDLMIYHLCKAIEHALCAKRHEQAEELRQCLCQVTEVAA